MSKKPQLSEKHWKAIGLIAEGKHSIKEVAEITGIGLSAMYKLVEGDTTVGSTALLFKAEIKKIHKKHAEEIRPILNTCKRKALRIIDGVLMSSSGIVTGYYPPASTTINIGTESESGNANSWNGSIATTMFYNRALSATEILQNFNAARSRYGI